MYARKFGAIFDEVQILPDVSCYFAYLKVLIFLSINQNPQAGNTKGLSTESGGWIEEVC